MFCREMEILREKAAACLNYKHEMYAETLWEAERIFAPGDRVWYLRPPELVTSWIAGGWVLQKLCAAQVPAVMMWK